MAYTEAETQELVEAYKQNKNVSELAAHFGRTTRSIISKLSRAGVYEKQMPVVTKRAGKKIDLILFLELAAQCEMPSLHKMTLADLEKLVSWVRASN